LAEKIGSSGICGVASAREDRWKKPQITQITQIAISRSLIYYF